MRRPSQRPAMALACKAISVFALVLIMSGTIATVHATSSEQSVNGLPGYDLALGETVYSRACMSCHDSGKLDAPEFKLSEDWQPRLDQGLDVLIQHALNGHGRMPPKGGYADLTDDDVVAAVAYIYDQARTIVSARQPIDADCRPNNLAGCSEIDRHKMYLLHFLWLLSGSK